MKQTKGLIDSMALYGKDETTKTKDAGDAPATAVPVTVSAPKKRRRWPVVIIVAVVVLALILALPRIIGFQRNTFMPRNYTTHTVTRGDIAVTLSGSGTLQPADSYTITSLISGEILTAPFEEGDIVGKDSVLYTVDSSDVEGSYQQAVNAVNQSQTAYDNALKQLDALNLRSDGDGTVTALNVGIGDTVAAGQAIATIRSVDVMELKVLFQREVAKSFHIGSAAAVYTSGGNDVYDGVITKIGVVDIIPSDNIIAREVTIRVKNPGTFTPSLAGYAKIGDEAALQPGTFEYLYETTLTAPSAGKVEKILAGEGARVVRDQIVVVLQSDAVDTQVQNAKNALEDAKLALATQKNRVADYTITSPISGTIVQKDYKAGDTMKSGAALCTVFDLSYLTLVLNVDELDIKKVQPGQAVTVTADAAPGEVYSGVVTKININGTTMNGVTSYPVTIKIEETGGLLPGMNVDATIVVDEQKNVITVPVSAVVRNNFVLVKSPEADAQPVQPGIPAGFVYTEVTLGPSNDELIVITGGLQEGDVIAVMDNTPSSYDTNPFMVRPVNRPENGAGSGPRTEGGAA